MHYLVELAIRIATIYGGIAAGFVLQRWSNADKAGKWLTFTGLNIFTPILLVVVMLNINEIQARDWSYILLLSALPCIFSLLLDWMAIRTRADISNHEKGAEIITLTFMNALFYPFPIIIGVVGTEGLIAASIFIIAQAILRNSLGVALSIHFGSDEGKSVWKVAQGILLFPPTLGILLGLTLRMIVGNVHTSDIVVLSIFRDITMFIMLALVGLSFRLPKRDEWREVALGRGIATRFGGGAIGAIITSLMPLPLIAKIPLIIQSISPPAVNNIAYTRYFHLDDKITSTYITLLSLAALLFLPIEIAILLWWKSIA